MLSISLKSILGLFFGIACSWPHMYAWAIKSETAKKTAPIKVISEANQSVLNEKLSFNFSKNIPLLLNKLQFKSSEESLQILNYLTNKVEQHIQGLDSKNPQVDKHLKDWIDFHVYIKFLDYNNSTFSKTSSCLLNQTKLAESYGMDLADFKLKFKHKKLTPGLQQVAILNEKICPYFK